MLSFPAYAAPLKLSSEDRKYELSLRGYSQLDGRLFLDDGRRDNQFIPRRLRPILEGKAENASFRLMPDFSGGFTRIFDAHADYKLTEALQFRIGKFKPPLGLERLQSATDTFFVERGHPTNLAPNRDLGFMVYGAPTPKLEYQAGVFNGNQDLGNTERDGDNNRDFIARIFTYPIPGLGIGIAGSAGEREGSAANTILGSYKTPAQQSFFKYQSGSFADGLHWRLYPQAYWYSGNTGLLAEYAVSNQEVTRGASHETLNNKAWQIAGSWVLTGEDVNFRGGIKPDNDFDFSKGGTGAWEVTARIGGTDIDNKAFPLFADSKSSASEATTLGGGLNWYLNENLKLMANYEFTRFKGGASGGKDMPDEHALLTRTQFRF